MAQTFVLSREDVKGSIHNTLWQSICESFGLNPETTEDIYIQKSPHDENKVEGVQ